MDHWLVSADSNSVKTVDNNEFIQIPNYTVAVIN